MPDRIRRLLGCALALAMLLPAAASAATFNVTTDSDSSGGTCLPASCTLRQAVAAVNAGGGGDTINVPAGLYTLTFGELQLQKSVSIDGAGPAATVVEGDALSRVFNVTGAGVNASIKGLAVENGRVAGTGGLQAHGGGILSAGTLTLDNVLVRGNAVVPAASTPGLIPEGGGIFNSGTLHVANTTITGNHANTIPEGGIPAGAGLANQHGKVDLADSVLSGNVSSDNGGIPGGGGLFSVGTTAHGASVTLTRVLVEGNRAIETAGGGIPEAGGILALATDLTIVDSTVRGNKAVGGAIADAGGIIVRPEGNFTLERSLVANNVAESSVFADGGGLYLGGEATDLQKIVNSTITANRATSPTGNNGGGIFHSGARLDVLSSTISGNVTSGSAASGRGGNLSDSGSSGSVLSLRDSIVSGGAGTSGFENCSGSGVQSAGHNIDSLDQCNFHAAGDKVKTNPLLAALADNGGPTETLALKAGSPAIDAGDAACPATDQRGVARPQGAACDIGAFELVPSPPPSGKARLRLLSGTVKINLKTGKGTARAKCLNVPTDECRVALTLFGSAASHKARAAKKRRGAKVGAARGTISGGKTGKLSFKLTHKGLRLLKRQRSHKLRVTAVGKSRNRLGQAVAISKKLTLKGKAAKKRR